MTKALSFPKRAKGVRTNGIKGVKMQKARVFPATVVVDTREQMPYAFADIKTDACNGYQPLEVRTTVRCLPAGDYSLEGFENLVAVERKSLNDLYCTLSQGRERFGRKLKRLAEYAFAAVVIEADWPTILGSPPERSRLHPRTIIRSVMAWQQRYPRIHWWPVPGRVFAERVTFQILRRFWLDQLPAGGAPLAKGCTHG